MSIANLPSPDKEKVLKTIKEISDSLTRVEAERSLQKEIIENITDTIDIEPRVLRRMAKTYHKNSFKEDVELNREFEESYSVLTGETPESL
jgi:hypothetical protein